MSLVDAGCGDSTRPGAAWQADGVNAAAQRVVSTGSAKERLTFSGRVWLVSIIFARFAMGSIGPKERENGSGTEETGVA